ncbi:MAG: tRNA (adenosine(37)-N6)-dimethylallyltransferase MiaA [Verrucomicrobiota bacterium]|nr:tRNA (adenosine(37)-N6)-dimethylallyltransferase MiaA [Verrucomicrobiota bacterium]
MPTPHSPQSTDHFCLPTAVGPGQRITVLGPTASGKTRFAVRLADQLDGEILSVDSRQVYRRMDLGTGKDLDDYWIRGRRIPVHLIDLVEPGTKFNVFEYQQAFETAFHDVVQRGKCPILCGGSGMYLESVLKGYDLTYVPPDHELRRTLEACPQEELNRMLAKLRPLHNRSDTTSKKRTIRAIEIARYQETHPTHQNQPQLPGHTPGLVLGLHVDRPLLRERITRRLHQRLEQGLVDEVRDLLNSGIPADTLVYYGLEYKFVTLYLQGTLPYDEMVERLNIAIHQFSKRQMTWFRRMERNGLAIHWIDMGAEGA